MNDLVDRLIGSGKIETLWAMVVVALGAMGAKVPESKGEWLALALIVVKHIYSKGAAA